MSDKEVVVRRVRDRLPALVRDTVAAVQEAIPTYRHLSDDQLRDVAAITSWTLLRLVETWAGDGDRLADADIARFRAIGGARAEDGRPLAAVLRAYRVAAVAATDAVVDAGGPAFGVADMRALTRVVLTATDQLSEALISGYTAARDRLTGDRDRAVRELLDDLLTGRQSSAGAVADRCRELDLTLPDPALVLVVEPDLDRPGGPLATVRGRRSVLLLPDPLDPALVREIAARGRRACAIGTADGVATAFRRATDALDAAPAHAFAGRAVLTDGDAQVLALLAGRPDADAARTAQAVLGPLADPAQRHLLDGLVAHLATGSATEAAEALHVHPQTLRYRMRRCVELTGRDVRDPWHHLVLDVACQAVRAR